jgi:hypothetical protein
MLKIKIDIGVKCEDFKILSSLPRWAFIAFHCE